MRILADTGPLLGIADRRDAEHHRCLQLMDSALGPWLVPTPVATETCFMIGRHLGPEPEAAFLDSVADGQLESVEIVKDDYRRMAQLIRQYSDFPLGTVDASVVAIAERLNIDTIATLDRRHFGTVRPRHVESFKLLP
jgi:uncharacterized protein